MEISHLDCQKTTFSLGMQGLVEAIFLAVYSGEGMRAVSEVEALEERGLNGDRYANRCGYWSGVDECQVTLLEGEIVDRIYEETGLSLHAGEHRRNIVTRGIRLVQLIGRQFSIGGAVLEYIKIKPPCAHLQSLSASGTAKSLFGQRAGIGARVVKGGMIRVSDPIIVVHEDVAT